MISELHITIGAAYTVWKLTYRSRTLTSETSNPIGGMMVSAPYRTRLDRAAWRPMHNRILLALGIGWALDSFEVQIIGSVLTPLANDFGVLGAATAATMNFWSIGGIAAGLIGIFFLNSFVAGRLALGGFTWSAWRLALLAGAAAAVYALIARRAIPESPRWLASQGRHADADAIITEISGLPDDGSDLVGTSHRRSLTSHIGELWTHWRRRLVYGMVLEFSGSAAYYGCSPSSRRMCWYPRRSTCPPRQYRCSI
jgi:Sugar (and other) transporter